MDWCRHCNRFGKGKSAHSTTEHKGTQRLCAYAGPPPDSTAAPAPAPSPAPTPAPAPSPAPTAGGNLATLPAAPASGNPATLPAGLSYSSVPVVSTDSFLQGDRAANYDFGVGSQDGFWAGLSKMMNSEDESDYAWLGDLNFSSG